MPSVLIADDDPLLVELVTFKLEEAGFAVLTAADGAAALEIVAARAPDAVVLDSMMPILTGPEVLRALKEDPRTAETPVIMLTARKGQSDIVDALRAGAADYLTKPFMPDELAARLSVLLARQSVNRAQSGAA